MVVILHSEKAPHPCPPPNGREEISKDYKGLKTIRNRNIIELLTTPLYSTPSHLGEGRGEGPKERN